jgi:hypothetical protein
MVQAVLTPLAFQVGPVTSTNRAGLFRIAYNVMDAANNSAPTVYREVMDGGLITFEKPVERMTVFHQCPNTHNLT